MPQKKHKSKQAGLDHTKIPAKEAAKASSSVDQQSLMSTKHDFSDDADMATASDRSKKRRKINSNTGLHHHDSPSFNIPVTTTVDNLQCFELTPDTSAQNLPPEVRHLSTKYNFTTMSILSSAKISDKVEKLLLRVENFSFADPKSKPGVVVLHAKSEVASKMVSIVEIARQAIERDKGRWWQYSKLDGQFAEIKAEPVKRRGVGRTLSEWQDERAEGKSQVIEGVEGETGCALEEVEHNDEILDGDEEMGDAFGRMVVPKEADQGAKKFVNDGSRKMRATPVMTVYFARVPVPRLKELYGEQTNS